MLKWKYEEEKINIELIKAIWNEKRKKWEHSFTQTMYIQTTVTEVFIDLNHETNDTANFKSVTKFEPCCLEKL